MRPPSGGWVCGEIGEMSGFRIEPLIPDPPYYVTSPLTWLTFCLTSSQPNYGVTPRQYAVLHGQRPHQRLASFDWTLPKSWPAQVHIGESDLADHPRYLSQLLDGWENHRGPVGRTLGWVLRQFCTIISNLLYFPIRRCFAQPNPLLSGVEQAL